MQEKKLVSWFTLCELKVSCKYTMLLSKKSWDTVVWRCRLLPSNLTGQTHTSRVKGLEHIAIYAQFVSAQSAIIIILSKSCIKKIKFTLIMNIITRYRIPELEIAQIQVAHRIRIIIYVPDPFLLKYGSGPWDTYLPLPSFSRQGR